MKRLLFVVLLFVASCSLFAGEQRDGSDWSHMGKLEKTIWAAGWIDGVGVSQRLVGEIAPASFAAYYKALDMLVGMTAEELVQGLNQFYDSDYRNLRIGMSDAALLLTRYSRAGLDKKDAMAKLNELREIYKGH